MIMATTSSVMESYDDDISENYIPASNQDVAAGDEDAEGIAAGYYIIVVILVYGTSIVFLIASFINRKNRKRQEDKQINNYLRGYQVILEHSRRDKIRNLKTRFSAILAHQSQHGCRLFPEHNKLTSCASTRPFQLYAQPPFLNLLNQQSDQNQNPQNDNYTNQENVSSNSLEDLLVVKKKFINCDGYKPPNFQACSDQFAINLPTENDAKQARAARQSPTASLTSIERYRSSFSRVSTRSDIASDRNSLKSASLQVPRSVDSFSQQETSVSSSSRLGTSCRNPYHFDALVDLKLEIPFIDSNDSVRARPHCVIGSAMSHNLPIKCRTESRAEDCNSNWTGLNNCDKANVTTIGLESLAKAPADHSDGHEGPWLLQKSLNRSIVDFAQLKRLNEKSEKPTGPWLVLRDKRRWVEEDNPRLMRKTRSLRETVKPNSDENRKYAPFRRSELANCDIDRYINAFKELETKRSFMKTNKIESNRRLSFVQQISSV